MLFDIDGTLVLDDGAAREAFAEALREVYQYEGDLGGFNFSGKTDPQIAFEVLEHGGLAPDVIAAGLDRLWPIYVGSLAGRLHKGRQRVLPGVEALLQRLEQIPEVTLAVLSGNIEAGAKIKLAPWGLDRYFAFGAFGSDSRHRADLPPVAARRVAERTGTGFAPREIVIIGDSIWDVRCGVPHDSVTIAVASGWTDADTLKAENPDFLFDSMEETEAWVEAILS